MSRLSVVLSLIGLAGCGSDIKITAQARCDGVLQPEEEFVDSPFDRDGDGYFDMANSDCSTYYEAQYLDCDDGDPDINPGAGEVTCDLIDNDCDPETIDSTDTDGDGYINCDECDDSNADVNPGRAEELCNGLDDDCDDSTPDAVDTDLDGWSECEDCNDFNEAINPGAEEIQCNGIDEDCNEDTPDEADFDADGASNCVDCDDEDELRSPEFEELCDDKVDNNCNDEVDEECSYTGIWNIDRNISYQCAEFYGYYFVNISFNQIYIQDLTTSVTVGPTSSGSQPGTTSGSFTAADTISTTNSIPGSCTETYSFDGTFEDSETFLGSFSARFSGSCLDCRNQSFTFTATKQ